MFHSALRTFTCLLVATGLFCADASAATISVMSFNIRNASGISSRITPPNGWLNLSDLINGAEPIHGRRLRVLAVIRRNNPDLLGVQESIALQTNDLVGELSDYEYFGVGRDNGNQRGEQNGIFYRADRFTRSDGGHFWLSDSPDVPGTTFASSFDSGNPRMVTWVVLNDMLTGAPMIVMNTYWSLSSSARNKSAELIRERLTEVAGHLPIIIMGDLNTSESSAAFGTLSGGTNPDDLLLVDAYRQVHEASNQERTFHGYNGGTSGSRIDHILYSEDDFIAIDATIDRTTYDGLYTSDHYPVTATLRMVPEPTSTILLCSFLSLVAGIDRKQRSKNSNVRV
jgi:endonuclease/exonuclease/phosphatase family metal-dependent hydrolase